MIEPLACAVRGQRVVGVRAGHTVLVLGSGVSGLLNIQIAKAKGATVVATDIDEYRLNKARGFGADRVVHAKDLADVTADRVIVCTGAPQAVDQAFASVDKKGVILLFAIPQEDIKLPTVDLWRNEITVTSSYGAGPVDLQESLDLIAQTAIDVAATITHKLPLSKIQEGFSLVAGAKESLKVVLEP